MTWGQNHQQHGQGVSPSTGTEHKQPGIIDNNGSNKRGVTHTHQTPDSYNEIIINASFVRKKLSNCKTFMLNLRTKLK